MLPSTSRSKGLQAVVLIKILTADVGISLSLSRDLEVFISRNGTLIFGVGISVGKARTLKVLVLKI